MRSNPEPLRILQVSTFDVAGGAERVAWQLFEAYRRLGHYSWLAVGQKRSDDPDVFVIPNKARLRSLPRVLRLLAQPVRSLSRWLGMEDFTAPGAWRLLSLSPQAPDLLHCHNLHAPPGESYFDLRALPTLSHRLPVVLTMHDAWLLTGHCAHSMDCDKWRTGCKFCSDLGAYPPVRRDATGFNWNRKRRIYSGSRLYISTPCHWLMEKVEQSIIQGVHHRVIPNGVDLSTFHPADMAVARTELGLPVDAVVALFVSHRTRTNPFRDYAMMEKAIAHVSERNLGRDLVFICLGEEAVSQRVGDAVIQFRASESDPVRVATYYQAADVYVHASKADTFPTAILEAMACGTPAVATAVGGIPEQIEDGGTGFLVPAGDAAAMASRIEQILASSDLRGFLSRNAIRRVRDRFDLKQQVEAYLTWYGEIVRDFRERQDSRQSQACDGQWRT